MAFLGEVADELGGNLAVCGAAELDAALDELHAQVRGVDERAVVGERDYLVVDGGEVRLGGLPAAGAAARRVARVPYRHMAREHGEVAFLEDLGDEPEVFVDGDAVVVSHGDARALLAAVLQRLQPEVGHAAHLLAWRVDAEDGAFLLGAVVLVYQEVVFDEGGHVGLQRSVHVRSFALGDGYGTTLAAEGFRRISHLRSK